MRWTTRYVAHEYGSVSFGFLAKPSRPQNLANRRSLSTSSVAFNASLPLPRSLPLTRGLLLLGVPVLPTAWPARLEFASPLLSATSQAFKRRGIAVNAYYDASASASNSSLNDISFEALMGPGKEERYDARLLFPDNQQFEHPGLTLQTLNGSDLLSKARYTPKEDMCTTPTLGRGFVDHGRPQEIFVCTHGSRDCRCSDRGGPLVHALREEINRRGLQDRVLVREIAHVGGHKYAANAILAPSLDMLSNLTEEHAPALLSHIMTGRPIHSNMWSHWRGRYGLSESQQAAIWNQVDPDRSGVESKEDIQPNEEKVTLRFQTWDGEVKEVKANIGDDLLHVGKENSLPSLEGVCGGNLECATCHLYLSPNPSPAPVDEPSEEEQDMLGYAIDYRDGESRLGCQVKVTPELVRWIEKGGVISLPRF